MAPRRSSVRALSDVDVVVMDISMPGMSGVVATRKLKALRPELPVVSLSPDTRTRPSSRNCCEPGRLPMC